MAYPYSAGQVLTAADLNADLGDSWTYPSLSSGWGQYGSGLPEVRYRKNADTLEINGIVERTGATTSGNTTIFTLGTGFVPAYYQVAICAGNDGSFKPVRITIPGNANVQLDASTTIPTNGFIWLTMRVVLT